VAHTGQFLFSAGGNVVHMWQINASVLAASAQLQGFSMPAYFAQLEGGF
jgi:hypothetical protein